LLLGRHRAISRSVQAPSLTYSWLHFSQLSRVLSRRAIQGWPPQSRSGRDQERRGWPAQGGGEGRAGHLPASALAWAPVPSAESHNAACLVCALTRPQTALRSSIPSQAQEYKRLCSGKKKIIEGNCPIRKVKCCLVAGTCSCRVLGAQMGDEEDRNASQRQLFTLSHNAGAQPAKKLPHRRFKRGKRKDLSI